MRAPRRYLLAALVLLGGLGGCSGDPGDTRDPATASKSGATRSAGSPASPTGAPTARTTTRPAAERTTSTLGPFPPVVSAGPTAVDSSAIRSPADLPGAFGCPPAVQPITIPATADAPEALVCASKLAGDEAIFLWYAGDPDQRYLALQTALGKAKYVRGGPNWVAGGMLDPAMGEVGGEVYK